MMKNPITYLKGILLIVLICACSSDDNSGGNNSPEESNEKQITGFAFNTSNNSELDTNVIGTINQDERSISVIVPYGTEITSLIPTIQVSNGASYSPTGAQNFINSVNYTITAENSTTAVYSVSVDIAPSTEATISSFSFLAENNDALSNDVEATINQGTQQITAIFPEGTVITALTPTLEISENATLNLNGEQNFSNPLTYIVTSQSGSISTSYEVIVTVEEEDIALGDKNVLMFIAHEQAYFSEYIVMKKALETAGYTVDVRSSNSQPAGIYTFSGNINATNAPGSNYNDFLEQFQDAFGGSWSASDNEFPDSAQVNIDGSILSIDNMMEYDALVVVGGTGAQAYRVDGTYSAQGTGDRIVSAENVEATAIKLNELALDALSNGKPVMAQCHGASVAPFWRIPGTSGGGQEALGYSILKGNYATGFPESATAVYLNSLDVNYRGIETGDLNGTSDRVTVSSSHSSFSGASMSTNKIITTRDWYSQTIAHAARTLLNIIETYPTQAELSGNVSVLIIHGGAVNTSDCGVSNQTTNDVPCNYGTGSDELPADYTDLVSLYEENSANDNYNITVDDLNILTGGTLPYDGSSISSIENYLSNYDVVVFYKHWASNITSNLQNAIINYADDGGGVLSIHHGLYNSGKSILVNNLFEAESSSSGWSANLTEHNLVMTNYGHFISTYGVELSNPIETPSTWSSLPEGGANMSYSYYPNIEIEDEIYNNMAYTAGATFGRGVNEITPLFSDNVSSSQYHHASGYAKLFDGSNDGSVGRVAFFEPGERPENYLVTSPYGQILRNAIIWLAQ